MVATVAAPTGTGLGALAAVSLRRAFRLRIEPNEVLIEERAAMERASPPITDPTQQAFMAWRRSVLLMAAMVMAPVALLHAVERLNFDEGLPGTWKGLVGLNVVIEFAFAAFLWLLLPRWTTWRSQSRYLALGWLVYFFTPFLVFLYPLASSIDMRLPPGVTADMLGPQDRQMLHATRMAFGVAVGGQAMLMLAPKIISLLQGMIRAGIATKTLFPGSTAPGWVLVLAAPLYIIVFYVFVLLPYHVVGSGLVVFGMLLVVAAKLFLVRAGLGLARPMRADAANRATSRALLIWLLLLAAGALMLIAGLWDLVSRMSVLSALNFVLSIFSNILVLTLIATDMLITGLDRARGQTDEEAQLADDVIVQIGAFTGTGHAPVAPRTLPGAPPRS